ncbi:RNA polymerase sigma factor [Ktedonosporobacter rubrisoli]|nr:RNA polymerase sigma factor [Ktedonosporobacter rubrisoli]
MKHVHSKLSALLAENVHIHFNDVVAEYQHQLYTFAYRLTGSAQDAEDIVQEAFVHAYLALATYPEERVKALKLRPWLYKITLNEFHHFLYHKRLNTISLDFSAEHVLATFPELRKEDIETLIEKREDLKSLLAQLPEHYRVAILCYFFAGLSYQEIASLFDQPLGTVKSTISRAIKLLRTKASSYTHQPKGEKGYGRFKL